MEKLYKIFSRGSAPHQARKRFGAGFVILFAVTLAAIFLAIALSVSNIALKEIKFGTSAKDTNEAFFASDTGIECALWSDKPPTAFPVNGPPRALSCAPSIPTYSGGSASFNTGQYDFIVTGLGNSGTGCAKVKVTKDADSQFPYTVTTIVSKGYNIGDASCNSSNLGRIEREIRVRY